jgi:predicted amidohydrolase YtcJ
MSATLQRLSLVSCLALVGVFLHGACQSRPEKADLVLQHGTIITMDEGQPRAQALAIRRGRIVAIGSDDVVAPYVGPGTLSIDLAGSTTIPGFIEGHGHFLSLGEAKMGLDLRKTTSWDEIVAMVRDAARSSRPGEWIVGRGWHQEKWTTLPRPSVEGFPVHAALSAISPNNPVLLTHASGHATIANGKAMEMAGITSSTPNPDGGEILHDSRGEPIGVFRENAQQLVRAARIQALAARTVGKIDADNRKAVRLATNECLSKGVTSFEDAGSSFAEIEFFKKLADEESLTIRLWVMADDSLFKMKQDFPRQRVVGYGNNHLTVRAIKCYMDGALGARGAWLLQPYSDFPSSTGLNTTPIDSIAELAELAIRDSLQICVHAIGDRANRETLDLYQRVFSLHPDRANLRWRIEHAQHLHPSDIPRFGSLGVIAAMQGIHCTSDAPFVLTRLGEERAKEGAYVWRSLLDNGAVIVNGTDTPVEDVDPIPCYYASVTRKLADGSVFYPDQRMTRLEALRSYTLDAAYGAFEEGVKGSLTPGKLADIAILSGNLLEVSEDQIPAIYVLATIVDGKIAYERPGQKRLQISPALKD